MRPRIPKRILDLKPYTPGRSIEDASRESGRQDTIKLASNENALGPSPAVLAALTRALPDIHRYPDGGATALAGKLAGRLGVDTGQIVFGNGSNEILELVARIFAGEGDEVLMSADAFLVYRLVTQAIGATAVRVPARGFHHDLDAMARAISQRTRVIFLANPNNPTGTIFRRKPWELFLAEVPDDVVVVLDEAYYEFVDDPDYPDGLDYLSRHPGLVVVRTFSKAYSLAALRIGYGVGSLELMDALARARQPFNVNHLAQVAAMAALDDSEHMEASCALVRQGRRVFVAALERLGLPYVESEANFILVDVGDGTAVTQAMLHRGVIVRPMSGYGFPSMIRITFGTAEENERCIAVLIDALGTVKRR